VDDSLVGGGMAVLLALALPWITSGMAAPARSAPSLLLRQTAGQRDVHHAGHAD